jgi:hypothetical protein
MEPVRTELKIIDFSLKHFECQGRKFYVKESLGFVRYKELQKLSLEFGYSSTFQDVFNHIKEAWDYLNQVKLGEAAVTLHNIMYGIVAVDSDKYDASLRLCALFIDEEGEDPTQFDEGKMREKIECWGKELDTLPFFQLAANLVPGWINVFQTISQNGLSGMEKNESVQS